MWDAMHQSGYFKNHPVYRDWEPEENTPRQVSKTDAQAVQELPEILRNTDFGADEVIFELGGDPFQVSSQEIDPLPKKAGAVWLQQIVILNRETVVLDIGCGYGKTEQWMWHYVKEILGVDISPYIIEICKERFSDIKNVHFYINNGHEFHFFYPEQFDFIYAFNLLQ